MIRILPVALMLAGCGADPAAFEGRLILESVTPQQMAESICQTAWDVKPGKPARACSWTIRDPLHPGMVACHIIFEQPGGAAEIVTELKNCSTIDQDIMKGRF